MSILNSNKINCSPPKLIGEILLEAGLISLAQLKTALLFQQASSQSKLGEIISSKGWLKQETVDFLVNICSSSESDDLIKYSMGQPIGYYLQRAGLLTTEQINNILQEQKKLGLKFCYIAVMKGFITLKTAEFFLKNILDKVAISPLPAQLSLTYEDSKINNQVLEEDSLLEEDNNFYEPVAKLSTALLDNNLRDAPSVLKIDDWEIESSPMWIDQYQ
jgi:hypothetical protein